MTGLSLAHYRIDEEIGRGGMGIVFKATDTKLNRIVALKVLPASALSSEEDRARFFREAQAAAQLQHPHIATVYQIDEAVPIEEGKEPQPGAEKRLFIAMEFVDGDSVADTIKKAPLPLPEVISIATQIAEALRAAHEKGIVHRDIKSANVMLTRDGVAKVLDFGLAKTNQSTMLTRMGSTLGTVAYMSPEQARGQEVDGRTDLYALGTMMYEMVAGRLPFAGDYEQAVLYGILNENPDPLTALRTGVPMQLEFVVNKLLAKEPDYRYQSAAGLLADLKSLDLTGSGHSRRSMAMNLSSGAIAPAASPAFSTSRIQKWVWGALGGVLILGLGMGWLFKPSTTQEQPPVRVLEIPIDEYSLVATPTGSPDKRYWALTGLDSTGTPTVSLWDLRTGDRSEIEGATGLFYPRFSPSGKWLLMSGQDGSYRMLVPTGRPIWIDSLQNSIWLSDEEILVADEDYPSTVTRVALSDGSRTELSLFDMDSTYTAGGAYSFAASHDVVFMNGARENGPDDLLAVNLDDGRTSLIVQNACCGELIDDRWLLYLSGEENDYQVVAQPFDTGSLTLQGVPVDIVSDIEQFIEIGVGMDDTFFQVPTFSLGQDSGISESLTWLDPDSGDLERLNLPADDYGRFDIAPDGDFIVIERVADGGSNLYTIDIESGTRQRLTYLSSENRMPRWSRSGLVYFSGGPPLEANIYAKNADGSGEETLVVEKADFPSLSTDEQWLVFTRESNGGDIYARNLRTGDEIAIDTTDVRATDPEFSANGRFVAYSIDPDISNTVSVNQRVVVRSFPDPSQQYVQVLDEQADDPKWSPDGEFLFVRNQGNIQRMRVSTSGAFRVLSEPETVGQFPGPTIRLGFSPPDGRLLVMHPGSPLQSLLENQQRIRVTESFSRYLEELIGS